MISVVIPAYKNTTELIHNLKHNLLFLADCEIIVVNDDPSRSIQESLGHFKSIVLVEHEKNKGFGGAVNTGIQRAHGSHVMLLNSDVVLHDDGFKKALAHFEKNKNLFAVGFAQKEKNERTVGKNRIFWHKGFIQHSGVPATPGHTAWAEGGSALFSKQLLEKLGGFDMLYSPFYWEDIDLSYRAWKQGYTVLFDPTILVTHFHESTIGKYFSSSGVKKIAYRNQFIFIWKNITSPAYLISHISQLLPALLSSLLGGDTAFATGFFSAVSRLPRILLHRQRSKKGVRLSDVQVLELFS